MPWGDGTGPIGAGPMTGRGAGFCAGYNVPGYMNPYGGIWMRGAFGRGRGFRHWYRATGLPGWVRANMGLPAWGWGTPYAPFTGEITPQQEADILKKQAEAIKKELESIEKRIATLEKIAAEEKK